MIFSEVKQIHLLVSLNYFSVVSKKIHPSQYDIYVLAVVLILPTVSATAVPTHTAMIVTAATANTAFAKGVANRGLAALLHLLPNK